MADIDKKNKIPITAGAIAKIKTYARILNHSECYGFLLTKKDTEDRIIYNAILAPNQQVSPTDAFLHGNDAAQAKAEIANLNYRPIGFWHSHGSLDTFHSGDDDANSHAIILGIAGSNEEKTVKYLKEGYDIEQGEIIIRKKGREIHITLDDKAQQFFLTTNPEFSSDLFIGINKKLDIFVDADYKRLTAQGIKNISIIENSERICKSTGIAYSIVVNKKGEVYAEIAKTKWCDYCEVLETKITKDVELQIMKINDDITIDETVLQKDIEERIIGFKKSK